MIGHDGPKSVVDTVKAILGAVHMDGGSKSVKKVMDTMGLLAPQRQVGLTATRNDGEEASIRALNPSRKRKGSVEFAEDEETKRFRLYKPSDSEDKEWDGGPAREAYWTRSKQQAFNAQTVKVPANKPVDRKCEDVSNHRETLASTEESSIFSALEALQEYCDSVLMNSTITPREDPPILNRSNNAES